MQKTILSAIAFLATLILSVAPSFAQPPEDNLNGKTIHLYVESDNFNAFYFQNGDLPFTSPSKYNYTITLTGRDIYQQDFFFTSNGTSPEGEHFKWKFGKMGLGVDAPEGRITVPEFQGKDTMWVVIDPAGPITAPPVIMLEAPKIINILNPWSTTAPVLIHGGNKVRKMSTTPGRCGWFTTLLLDPTIVSGHFAEVNRTDTYGLAGLSSTADFDFAAQFAAHGKSIWLNTEANAWTSTWPNKDGDCQYLMAATVRDFSMAHPDFDFGNIQGSFHMRGMVQPTIGPDRKPVSTGIALRAPTTYGQFENWWKTDSTNANPALRSYESCVDIPMSKSSDGLWEYDSYRDSPTDRSFFPIEGTAHNKHGDVLPPSCYVKPPPDSTSWVTNGPRRNGNFCMESHATFIYQPGQTFSFRGDDDVWVFINDSLVVDLGGVHTPMSDSVNLDALNLTPGQEYKWDFFYCDRQPCGSSLRVKTSIFFKQQKALFGIQTPGPTPGSINLEIWKREGGKGSCATAGGDVVDSTRATNLTYQLLDATGKVVEPLANGVFHGGITIATPLITIDTSKITTAVLVPGATYRIVAFEPANQALKVEIPFKVPVRSFVEMISPLTSTAKVGQLVMVIAGARESGLPIAQVVNYNPIIPVGLEVYSDAAGTQRVLAGPLSTAATGFDTLWVTGTTTATTDVTYSLLNPLPATNVLKLTFTVPKNRVEFEPLVPAPAYSREVPVGSQVILNTANREADTLVAKAESYTLKIPDGLKVFTDAAMTIPVASNVPITTDPTGLDILYATADSTDPVTKTYILEITGSTKTMTLTFVMPPLDLPKAVSSTMYDTDGDGIGDSLVTVYDRDVTAGMPKQIGYRWPVSAAPIMVAGAALAPPVGGTKLVHKGKFSPEALTFGSGEFLSVYPARGGDSTQTLPIADGIGPIILKAEMILGTTHDTLRILFSESVVPGTVPAGQLFGYQRTPDGAVEAIEPAGISWSVDGKQASLVFAATAENAPRTGNLVRITDGPGHIADAAGNTAGPHSRPRLITGGRRSDIKAITYREIVPTHLLLAEPSLVATLEPTNATIEDVAERTGRLGHLIKTDLGNYAVKDGFTDVEPSQVSVDYQVYYATNHGVPVTSEKRTLFCTDTRVFSAGNCLNSRGHLFVGWNYTAKDGTRVATGAYVVRFYYQVKVAGKVVESNVLEQVWGIVRKQ